jgi:SAM-dependent methyltransferase
MMVIGAAERTIMNTMVSPIPLEEAACALCGSNDKTLEYTVEDWRYGLPGNFGVVRCRRCGLVYTSPRPTPAAIGVFYPSTYLPHTSLPANPTRPLLHALRQLVFGGRKSVAAALLGFIHNSVTFRGLVWRESFSPRVLDIGCGVGEYLGVWQALGWDIEGVEANEAAAALASSRLSVNIHVSNVEDLQLPEERFDLITMSHCLEHTYSPGHVLERVHRWLKPDGRLLVMVPNYDAIDRRLFGERWLGFEVPRHLFHFDERSIRRLLEQQRYRVQTIGASAQPDVFIRNVLCLMDDRAKARRPSTVEKALGAAVLAPLALLKKSTSLWVEARKLPTNS